MAPYRYETARDPYTASIGEMLARRGDIEAQRAAQVANIQAQAQQARGQAWGGAVQSIGQTLAAIPQQLQQQKRVAMADEAASLELDARRRENKTRLVFETALKTPENYTAKGTIDDAKVSDFLRKNDVGAWQQWTAISAANQKNALELAAKAAEIDKTTTETADKQRAFGQAQADYLGGLAYIGQRVLNEKPDDYLHARDTFVAAVARAAADGAISETNAKRALMESATAKNEELHGLFGQFITPEIQAKWDKQFADAAKATADAKKTDAEAANIRDYGSVTPPTSQTHNMRLRGVGDVPVDYVPDKGGVGGKWFYQGKDVTGDVSVIPAASVMIRNDKDAQGAENRDEIVEMVADGRMAPSMLSKRTDDYNATLAALNKKMKADGGRGVDLNHLQLQYDAAKKWASVQNGPQMVRFKGLASSVVNTIDEVKRLGDELKQGSIQKWNSASRKTVQQLYGNTPQSDLANRYMIAVNTLKEEFANLANGGYAPTEDAWKLANSQINGDLGFKDLTSSLSEVQRLINYRVNALEDVAPVVPGAPPAASGSARPIQVGGFTVTVN